MFDLIFNVIDRIVFKIKSYIRPKVRLIKSKKLRNILININNKFTAYTYKKAIIKYYKTLSPEEISAEKKEVLEYLKSNPATLFPYEFTKKYKPENINVFIDNKNKLKYVLFDNKRLYFKRSCTEDQVKSLFSFLLLVQDMKSPHRYLTEDFNVSKNDVVVDIGCAEGDFSLSIIEKVRKVYLFETDVEMIEALKATFEPWREKVIIVNKYVSNKLSADSTTLDMFFKNYELPNFLKIDVEGAEYDLLLGAKQLLLNNHGMRVTIACYHRHNDEILLRNQLNKYNFKTAYSQGYMLSTWDDIIQEPFLRRGLIRAIK